MASECIQFTYYTCPQEIKDISERFEQGESFADMMDYEEHTSTYGLSHGIDGFDIYDSHYAGYAWEEDGMNMGIFVTRCSAETQFELDEIGTDGIPVDPTDLLTDEM